MRFRKYQAADRNRVTQLWTDGVLQAAAYNQPNAMLKEALNVDDLVFVAEDNHQITGDCIAGYADQRAYLYSIAISPLKGWPKRVALW